MEQYKTPWKNGDKVYFYLADKKYYGTIIGCAYDENQYKISFISAVIDGDLIFAEEWLAEKEIQKYRTKLNSWIFPGDIVEFITEKSGLKLGITLDTRNIGGDEYYDFGFYNISPQNKVEYVTNKNVSRNRIAYISTSENEYKILPVKKGNRVEFYSNIEGKRIAGKVHDIYAAYNLPLFSIKYRSLDEFGCKEQIIEDDVTLDAIWLIR